MKPLRSTPMENKMDNDIRLLLGMSLDVDYCDECIEAYVNGIEPGMSACDIFHDINERDEQEKNGNS